MNLHLLLHDLGYVIDLMVAIFMIGLISYKAKPGISKVTLIIAFISVIIFVVSHSLGVSVTNSELSRKILMFNLNDIFMPLTIAHCVFALLGKAQQQKKIIIASYTVAFGILVFFIINPSLFLLESTPKLYFPNYYVPGKYYWVMLLFFFSLSVYFFYWMIKQYRIAQGVEKNRIKYFFIALILGYIFGSIDFLLIYNIPADPLWGALFVPLFSIPFIYAALQYEIMDISVIAKKSFVYSLMAGAIGVVLSILNYINTIIIRTYPTFPDWASSTFFALISAIAVILIWSKLREADILKYEFMNVVTHKFRTPLTSIKWTIENMRESATPAFKENIDQIELANSRLVDLTNILVNLSSSDDRTYEYTLMKIDIGSLLNECVSYVKNKSKINNIDIVYIEQPEIFVVADSQKIKFVFQTLLDNAVSYSPKGGKITIDVKKVDSRFSRNSNLSIKISDTGIGIPKDEIRYIFTKFYRAKNGRKADTEGMGIGLYLSKRIIERHEGKITVESEGEDKGTALTITLPLAK